MNPAERLIEQEIVRLKTQAYLCRKHASEVRDPDLILLDREQGDQAAALAEALIDLLAASRTLRTLVPRIRIFTHPEEAPCDSSLDSR